jgi:protein TonB
LGRILWELRLPQGRNSVALAASFSSTRSESEPTARLEPIHVAGDEPAVTRRRAEAPNAAATQFASAQLDRRRPPPAETPRPAADERPAPPQDREPTPPKRTAPVQLPQQEVRASVESVASAPSAASSGVQAATPPSDVVSMQPIYPPAALAAGWEGVVKLYVRLNDRGEVVEADVYQSSGHEVLDRAALEAIYRWRFTPPDGARGIAAEFIKPIPFRIIR